MTSFTLEAPSPQMPRKDLPFHEWANPDGTIWTQFYHADDGCYLLRFPGLADFCVSFDGLTVKCLPNPGVDDSTAQHLYLNQVLPLALSKQGKLVFHASAVEVAGGAVAFVAVSGRGKSTLAASFAINGFRFLTDDGLVVELVGDSYQVAPSHPSIRLWEDSEEALILQGAEAAPVVEFTSKTRFLAGAKIAFCGQPKPLRRVYFLGDGGASELVFEKMNAADAFVEWVKHSFLLDVNEKPLLASHFDQVARLSNQPIHYRLDFPRCYEDLGRVRQAIIEHASREESA